MLKKMISFSLLLSCAAALTAQCTPDLSCLSPGATSGVCPSSGLDTGTVGIPFSEVISVKVPPDGTDFGQPLATILHVDILSVDSLAPGLTYNCSPSGCSFPGNSNGCILVYGTPTTAWDHKLIVHAKAYVRILFVNTTQAQTLNSFYSVVMDPAGIVSLDQQAFEVSQNRPNPFSNTTRIEFTSPDGAALSFRVLDMMGVQVYERMVKPQPGVNTIELGAGLFTAGIYTYFLGNDRHSAVRKMVVTEK